MSVLWRLKGQRGIAMILWGTIIVTLSGMLATLYGVLAVAGAQSRLEEHAVRAHAQSVRKAA